MAVILHMSDLHFGPPFVPAVGEALLRFIDDHPPDLFVISGDFTEHATDEEFSLAAEFLNQLPQEIPRVVIPGNHDVPQLPRIRDLLTPFRKYRQYISEELDQTASVDGVTAVALNSTTGWGSWQNGWMARRRLEWCRQVMRAAPDKDMKIFVTHHHLAPAPDYKGGSVMHRAKLIMSELQKMEVDLVLGGHLHRSYIGNSLDFYPGLDRTHGIVIAQSGTTTSRRGRAREKEKNSFNLITAFEETLRIRQMIYLTEKEGFVTMADHLFPRRNSTGLGMRFEVNEAPAEQVEV